MSVASFEKVQERKERLKERAGQEKVIHTLKFTHTHTHICIYVSILCICVSLCIATEPNVHSWMLVRSIWVFMALFFLLLLYIWKENSPSCFQRLGWVVICLQSTAQISQPGKSGPWQSGVTSFPGSLSLSCLDVFRAPIKLVHASVSTFALHLPTWVTWVPSCMPPLLSTPGVKSPRTASPLIPCLEVMLPPQDSQNWLWHLLPRLKSFVCPTLDSNSGRAPPARDPYLSSSTPSWPLAHNLAYSPT